MDWHKEFEAIKEDNIHGASFLLQRAAKVITKLNDRDRQEALELLPTLQPYMAPFYNLARFLQNGGSIETFFDQEIKEKKILIQRAAKLIQNRYILTHSFSSLVYEAILRAKPKVLATKSAPLNEGEQMARKLLEQGIEVEVIEDGAAPFLVQEVDIVLFGADGIGRFGLVHKIGSLGIALAAKLYNKELYALATSMKFWDEDFILPPQPLKDAKEVSALPARNYYFDITPSGYFIPLTPN